MIQLVILWDLVVFFGYLGNFYGIYGPCWVAIGPALQVLLSNVAAIEQNTRYVEEDLNR